ncbi:MAG: circularly permuted type 2 ATP-grasp protein [Moraxellaceae bacterium]|nr:circularly permuted type 2 ATP-grasp protein [Pseudomonadales bacterium]MCB1673527.1 circularly permuted type 2 ATP-grasp protein [Pseudomonadales bacterium]MCP5173634.1 circularly permuted type 2 ATP-grasp protein [Moraxellaceae bacterium]MCP5178164.1 circularly permuted type 2 ATP-grasp protein [Moraxellaceae bacterium]
MMSSEGCRESYQHVSSWLQHSPLESLLFKKQEADLRFRQQGITFTVYGEETGTERLIPFDMIPRIISADEWAIMSKGCEQRVQALNAFLHDIYHEQLILKAGIIPPEQILGNEHYQAAMQGLDLPHNIYAHIAGIDLIRHSDGTYYVLEDNLRTPSGVSYMLENRKMTERLFPELLAQHKVEPVAQYPDYLKTTLLEAANKQAVNIAVLTPGRFNSAFFEHAFLARSMGVNLVGGSDLVVNDDVVYMKTISGLQKVDVIYRRLDDAFIDPLAFNPQSMLGVAGLMSAYRAGNVVLANAVGTGVADDKSVYPFVPDMIRFYLNQDPILQNVPTFQCRKPDELSYVLANLSELVVKETQGSGGYGMLIGPAATQAEIEEFRAKLTAHPAAYIAQPTLALSTCPTFVAAGIAPRHIDLRPFVLSGKTTRLVAGGLTRVALKSGSLVVNSSQGGGTKDTWVLAE